MKAAFLPGGGIRVDERDACAIIGFFKKHGQPTHGNLQRTVEALIKMGHRAGGVGGEGDGCGVLTDIPRLLWREILAQADYAQDLAEAPEFAVGHLLLPRTLPKSDLEDLQQRISEMFTACGCRVLLQRPMPVRSEILSASARDSEPLIWQVAMTVPDVAEGPALLYRLHVALSAYHGLQGARGAGNAGALLSGSETTRFPVGGDHRSQPVFHQHSAHGVASSAFQPARTQW
jgi:glutamate synthase (NADPH/NADH) large chain